MALDLRALSAPAPQAPSINVGAIASAGQSQGGGFDGALRALEYVQQRKAIKDREARAKALVTQPGELMHDFQINATSLMQREKVSLGFLAFPGLTPDHVRAQLKQNYPTLTTKKPDGTIDESAIDGIVKGLYTPTEVSWLDHGALDNFATGRLEDGAVDSSGAPWRPEAIDSFLERLPRAGVPITRAQAIESALAAKIEGMQQIKSLVAPMTSRQEQGAPGSFLQEAKGFGPAPDISGSGSGEPRQAASTPAPAAGGAQGTPPAPPPLPPTQTRSLGAAKSPIDYIVAAGGERMGAGYQYPFSRDFATSSSLSSSLSPADLGVLARYEKGDSQFVVDVAPVKQPDGTMRSVVNLEMRSRSTGKPMKPNEQAANLIRNIEATWAQNPNSLFEAIGQAGNQGVATRQEALKAGEAFVQQFGIPAVQVDPSDDPRTFFDTTKDAVESRRLESTSPGSTVPPAVEQQRATPQRSDPEVAPGGIELEYDAASNSLRPASVENQAKKARDDNRSRFLQKFRGGGG